MRGLTIWEQRCLHCVLEVFFPRGLCCHHFLACTLHPRRIGHEVPPVVAQRQLQEPSAGICGNWKRPGNLHLVSRDLLQHQRLVRTSWHPRLVAAGSGLQPLHGVLAGGWPGTGFEVKAPLAELHFVAVATAEARVLSSPWHRGPLRPDAPKRPCGCYSDLEPRRLVIMLVLMLMLMCSGRWLRQDHSMVGCVCVIMA